MTPPTLVDLPGLRLVARDPRPDRRRGPAATRLTSARARPGSRPTSGSSPPTPRTGAGRGPRGSRPRPTISPPSFNDAGPQARAGADGVSSSRSRSAAIPGWASPTLAFKRAGREEIKPDEGHVPAPGDRQRRRARRRPDRLRRLRDHGQGRVEGARLRRLRRGRRQGEGGPGPPPRAATRRREKPLRRQADDRLRHLRPQGDQRLPARGRGGPAGQRPGRPEGERRPAAPVQRRAAPRRTRRSPS